MLAAGLLAAGGAQAQDKEAKPSDSAAAAPRADSQGRIVGDGHSIKIGGQAVPYKATASPCC